VNVRVAIFEDDPGYREGLAALLRHAPGFELVGVHGAAAPAVRAAEQAAERGEPRPWDLVLSDIEMPGMSGIEACRRLKEAYPGLPVIVLTVFEEPATILDAIRAGADGYLLKRSTAPELLAGLRAIAGGGAPLTAAVARSVLELLRQGDGGPASGSPFPAAPQRLELGEREQEVLRGLVRGGTYAQIADEMGISLDTVRGHIRSVYRKLQVNSAKAAVSRAVRERLV
jgi:DNA-binding NarL/FixJ family response regulator